MRHPVMCCVPWLLSSPLALSLRSPRVPGVLPLRNRNCFWPRSLSSLLSFSGVGRGPPRPRPPRSAVTSSFICIPRLSSSCYTRDRRRRRRPPSLHLCPHLWTRCKREKKLDRFPLSSLEVHSLLWSSSPLSPLSPLMTSAAFKVPT